MHAEILPIPDGIALIYFFYFILVLSGVHSVGVAPSTLRPAPRTSETPHSKMFLSHSYSKDVTMAKICFHLLCNLW